MRAAFGGGGKLHHFGLQQDALEQLVDAGSCFGGDADEGAVAAEVFGDKAKGDQIVSGFVGVGAVLVDFGDGGDDGRARGFGLFVGFFGLGHHAVVGCDDEDDDVGGFGSAFAHGGESGVPRGVDEGDQAARGMGLVGADALGDAPGFAAGDFGGADAVKEAGFAVVDVAHDGDHGRARDGLRVLRGGFGLFLGPILEAVAFCGDGFMAHFFDQDHGGFLVELLVDGGGLAEFEKVGDQAGCLFVHALGQIAYGDGFGHGDFDENLLGGLLAGRAAVFALFAPEAEFAGGFGPAGGFLAALVVVAGFAVAAFGGGRGRGRGRLGFGLALGGADDACGRRRLFGDRRGLPELGGGRRLLRGRRGLGGRGLFGGL